MRRRKPPAYHEQLSKDYRLPKFERTVLTLHSYGPKFAPARFEMFPRETRDAILWKLIEGEWARMKANANRPRGDELARRTFDGWWVFEGSYLPEREQAPAARQLLNGAVDDRTLFRWLAEARERGRVI